MTAIRNLEGSRPGCGHERRSLYAAFALLLATALLGGWRPEGSSETSSATEETIAALIQQLGDPSYEKRQMATRQLCAVGAPAVEQLRAAAKLDNTERALRARSLLEVIDQLMFTGVEVQLAFSRSTIAWHDPVDLNVTMVNRAQRPARVPFDLDSSRRADLPDDALQVGDLLDIADCIHVVRHDGESVELKVDDISADPGVAEAVQSRIEAGPVSILPPGQRVTLTVRDFNRGWARFPMLGAGVYTVVVDYVPPWKDEVLASDRVGRVISNPVSLRVTDGAPDSVSRTSVEASIRIRREVDTIIAELTNHTDQVMVVNRNFGSAAPFAQGAWLCEFEGGRKEIPAVGKARPSWHEFDPSLLIELPAGQSLELTRISADELRRMLANGGPRPDQKAWTVTFAYVNLCNRAWQVRQGNALLGNTAAPAVLQSLLPRRMLSARHTSDRLALWGVD